MALTGYYKTLVRPRAHPPLSMLKYDPVGTIRVDFPVYALLVFDVVRVGMVKSPCGKR